MKLDELRDLAWPLQEKHLRTLLEDKANISCSDLHQAVRHQVFAGGKRLRASLPIAGAIKLSGQPSALDRFDAIEECPPWIQSALILGLALELLHSGTLAHDDVMDGDKVRRNKPTVWVKHGVAQAINTGDDLFYLAQELVSDSNLPIEAKMDAQRWMTRAMQQVIHGQALEIWMRRERVLPRLETYVTVVAGKTGGLFGLGLVYGGISAELNPVTYEGLYAIGRKLGALFQVQDDLVDLVGEKQRGTVDNDLWEGKPSWLIAYCASQMDQDQKDQLQTQLYLSREEKTEEHVRDLRRLLDEHGAIEQGLLELKRLQRDVRNAALEIHPASGDLMDDVTRLFLSPLSHLL